MDEEIRDSDTLLDPFMASSLENRFEEYAKDFEVAGNPPIILPTKAAAEQEILETAAKLANEAGAIPVETKKEDLPVKKVQLESKPRVSTTGSEKNRSKILNQGSLQGSFHSQQNTDAETPGPHDHLIGEFIENRDDAAMGATRTLLPLETKLVCGIDPGSTAILEGIKESTLPPQSPSEEKANHIISSAVKWLSAPSNDEEQKFYLLTNSGEVVDPIANGKRDREFHELFPQIELTERLIEDYTCAWFNDVLLHGRMYISENHICFYTKVIWTYTVVLPMSNVLSIEKKVFGGFFDNSMEIQTKDNKKYYFSSFIYRNLAFDILTKVVNGYPSNIIQLKLDVPRRPSFATLSQERRSRSDGSLNNDIKSQPRTSSASYRQSEELRIAKGLADIVDIPRPPSSAGSEGDSISKKHVIHQKIKVNAPTREELKTPPRLIPLPSLPDKPFVCECVDIHKTQRYALDEKIALNLEHVFESLVYSDSKFLRKFWTSMNYTGTKSILNVDLQITDWVPATADLSSPDLFKPVSSYLKFADLNVGFKRQTQYVRPINNPLGPKTSICIITETIKQMSKRFYCYLWLVKFVLNLLPKLLVYRLEMLFKL